MRSGPETSFLQAKVLPARTLLSCTYPGNALALLLKDEVVPALAFVTALMLTGCHLNLLPQRVHPQRPAGRAGGL